MKEDLAGRIAEAFGGVELGNGLSLHQAWAMDLLRPPEEVLEARALDTEKNWQDIPDDAVEQFHYALTFMDPEGLRFHLPRYMIYGLEHPGLDAPAVDAAVYACDFGEDPDQEVVKQFNAMSRTQMECIAQFLVFVAGASDEHFDTMVAAIALEAFWYQFLEQDPEVPDGSS